MEIVMLRGFLIAMFLYAVGLDDVREIKYWVAVLSLNFLFVV